MFPVPEEHAERGGHVAQQAWILMFLAPEEHGELVELVELQD